MNKIKHALTRKFGPLPAWAWALIAGVAWYEYRKYTAASATVTTNTPTTGENQPPLDIPPGDSVYDPNSGELLTAPGGGDTGTSQGAGSSGTGNGTGGGDSGGGTSDNPTTPPGAAPPVSHPTPRLRGKGAIRAPFGHKKPKAPNGYEAKGLGNGFWEFVPDRRKPKPKAAHKPPKPVTRKGRKTSKPRSPATTRTTGGRPVNSARAAIAVAPVGRTRNGVQAAAIRPDHRQRATAPAIHTTINQRPIASNPRPSVRSTPQPAPRPSAPRATERRRRR